jgi:hypothetical protein
MPEQITPVQQYLKCAILATEDVPNNVKSALDSWGFGCAPIDRSTTRTAGEEADAKARAAMTPEQLKAHRNTEAATPEGRARNAAEEAGRWPYNLSDAQRKARSLRPLTEEEKKANAAAEVQRKAPAPTEPVEPVVAPKNRPG